MICLIFDCLIENCVFFLNKPLLLFKFVDKELIQDKEKVYYLSCSNNTYNLDHQNLIYIQNLSISHDIQYNVNNTGCKCVFIIYFYEDKGLMSVFLCHQHLKVIKLHTINNF